MKLLGFTGEFKGDEVLSHGLIFRVGGKTKK
jgi:hypothetical protein